MIIFENAGEIDPRAVMLIGVNVKTTDTAIGFFGTGLKYAVSCLLRWGETLTIQSGEAVFEFMVDDTEIRGRSFGIPVMYSRFERQQLGFTTELGKQWQPWMVYRELWCNAFDEQSPAVYEETTAPRPSPGITRVIVSGPKMQEAHERAGEFILAARSGAKKLFETIDADIYEGPSTNIFYRGIAVRSLQKPSLYTYNIKPKVNLTEDRTASEFETSWHIAAALMSLTDEDIISRTIKATADDMESTLNYSYHSGTPQWDAIARDAAKKTPLAIARTVREKFVEVVPAELCPTCGQPVAKKEESAHVPF